MIVQCTVSSRSPLWAFPPYDDFRAFGRGFFCPIGSDGNRSVHRRARLSSCASLATVLLDLGRIAEAEQAVFGPPKTVERRVGAIRAALDAPSRLRAVQIAREQGWVVS